MCQAYADLGHKVTLLVPDWKVGIEQGVADPYSFYGVYSNFAIRKVPIPRWKPLDFLHRTVVMPLVAVTGKPNLIHSRSLSAAWGLTKLFRVATILELHQPITNPKRNALFRQIVTSKRTMALVMVTHMMANQLRASLPNHLTIIVAPDGVDEGWVNQKLSIPEARNRINLSESERRVVVYAGHLYPGRGIDLIFQIAAKLPDHLFIIVGGRETELSHYRRKLDNLTNLKLLGFKPPADVFAFLQAANVLLMPYGDRVEASGGGDIASFTSPMKMFEYMAAGRPILASNLPILKEVLTNGSNALLLPYNQPELWIDALKRLQNDSILEQSLGQTASEVVAQYTWTNRAKHVLYQCGFA